MPKKNNQAAVDADQTTAAEGEQQLDNPEDRHRARQAERRELEAKLMAIDGKIREAINAGDVATLDSLTAQKAELPGLFIAASVAETSARHEIVNAEDEGNLKTLQAAIIERDKLQAALIKRQAEVEAELAQMRIDLQAAEGQIGSAYATISASRDRGAIGEAGFKKSISLLAGI